jgi:hypothetical protein
MDDTSSPAAIEKGARQFKPKPKQSLLSTRVLERKLLDNADKWGSFMQRVRWVVNTLTRGIARLFTGLFKTGVMIAFLAEFFIMFVFYGIVLYVIRSFILFIVVEIAGVAGILASIIDAVLKFFDEGFNALYDTVNGFMAFVNHDLIGTVNKVLKALSMKKIPTVVFNGLRYVHVR